ncbi:UspA [Sesbania bispinosa]|nr:UspA [Sesbania bispinosa]
MAGVSENERRRIMVAIDEGEESLYALSWCLKNLLFQDSKDSLILLYVKPPRAVYSAFDGTGYLFSSDITATMERYSQQVADSVLEKAKRLCNNIENVETKVENGDPRDVICQMVQRLGVDILVMGSHGYGVIKRAFLGSVSNYCAQNVKCPVLIVKKPKSNAGGGDI